MAIPYKARNSSAEGKNMPELQETLFSPEVVNIIGQAQDNVLPDPDTLNYYIFAKDRRIYLDDDVSPSVMSIQKMIMRWNVEDLRDGKTRENAKPIWLYIMSYGGELDYMWVLIDAIKTSIAPVYTVNLGVAASAAALIFVCGDKRFMTEHATVIVHEGSAQLAGDAVKVQDAADSYRQQLKQMKEFILSHTEIPRQQLMKKRSNDWTLNAGFCLRNKVCDRVITSMREIL